MWLCVADSWTCMHDQIQIVDRSTLIFELDRWPSRPIHRMPASYPRTEQATHARMHASRSRAVRRTSPAASSGRAARAGRAGSRLASVGAWRHRGGDAAFPFGFFTSCRCSRRGRWHWQALSSGRPDLADGLDAYAAVQCRRRGPACSAFLFLPRQRHASHPVLARARRVEEVKPLDRPEHARPRARTPTSLS
jgi:hypothetical protein